MCLHISGDSRRDALSIFHKRDFWVHDGSVSYAERSPQGRVLVNELTSFADTLPPLVDIERRDLATAWSGTSSSTLLRSGEYWV